MTEAAPPPAPDTTTLHLAQAEAALLLVESLLLTLVERRVLTPGQADEVIAAVIRTKRELVEDGSRSLISEAATGLVTTVRNSVAAAAPLAAGRRDRRNRPSI